MYRKIIRYFEEWKADPYRKPLILQGARQVGKTYSILEFGRTHEYVLGYQSRLPDPGSLPDLRADHCPGTDTDCSG